MSIVAQDPGRSTPEDRWLPPAEAAAYLGVETSTLAKWRYNGQGPPYSCALGRDPRYRLSALVAFMEGAIAQNTIQARQRRRELRTASPMTL